MRKKIFVLSVLTLTLLFSGHFAVALDWKDLHEEADRTTLSQARAAADKAPDSLDRLYVLGLVYLNLHREKDAETAFQRMLRLSPDLVPARWAQAELLRRSRKLEESEQILTGIIEQDAEFFPAYISLAYLKYTQLDFKHSVKLATHVSSKGREKVDLSNYTRAYLLIAGGKGMLAYYGGPLAKIINGTAVLPTLKKAQRLQPESPAVLFGLGSFYFLSPGIVGGDLDKAEEHLLKAVSLDPLFADAYVRLAQVYKVKGQEDKYQLYLNKALEIDPQNELALDEQSGECKFICVSVNE